MSGSDRKRQKKLEATRKKRELLKKEARKREAQFQGASLLRIAQGAPFGPAWVSAAIDEQGEELAPAIVTVVVSRRVRGLLLAEIVLVDRTCLGVKNAILLPLFSEAELLERLDALAGSGDVLRACEPLEAQSVVFHALDYARSLGFFAHEHFEIALFEPRPAALVETPLATPARPIYIPGPNDDVRTILNRLDEHVGRANYDFLIDSIDAGSSRDYLLSGDAEQDFDEHDDLDEDDDLDQDVLETTGETLEKSPE